MPYPVENLLRRPYELYSAIGMSGLAVSTAVLSYARIPFGPNPQEALPVAACICTYAAWRAWQGWRIVRYKRGLRKLPVFQLGLEEIPHSTKAYYVGTGFQWDARHVQRLVMAREPQFAHLSRPSWAHDKARELELKAENAGMDLRQHTSRDTWWNPARPLPPVGGDPLLHAVGLWEGEKDVWFDLYSRVGHVLVLGTTRVGKTRFLELQVTQDIRRGDTVLVFDPKGDAALLKRMYAEAKRAGRLDRFYVFHLGFPELSARYNGIGDFSRVTEIATRITNQLPQEGEGANFAQFVWGFVNSMGRALVALGRKVRYVDILRYASDIEPLVMDYCTFWLDNEPKAKGWKEAVAERNIDMKNVDRALKGRSPDIIRLMDYIRDQGLYDPVAHSLIKIISFEQSFWNKLVASLIPLLEKLTTGQVAELLNPDYEDPDDPRPIFDWEGILRGGGIVYVGLDSLSDYEVAGAVGNSMFSDLTSLAGRIYKDVQSGGTPIPKCSVHADEFNELIGDEFVPLLNKAGGAGYQVTVYTQTWSDIEARIGNKAKAGQIAGNLNSVFMLRVKNPETAEILTKQLGKVWINTLTPVTGANDNNNPEDFDEFSSKNEDRINRQEVDLLTAADLTSLPKGQAYAYVEGRLYKLRLPLPDPADEEAMPKSLAHMVREMARRHENDEFETEAFEGLAAPVPGEEHGVTVEGKGCGW